MSSVTLRELTKQYAGNGALSLDSVSLEVAHGEFMCLVGPSGCGKTTALRMIAGLESVTSGDIEIGDRVVNDLPPRDRDIALVFQSYALYPHMTVFDNMSFGLKLRKVPRTRSPRLSLTRRAYSTSISILTASRPNCRVASASVSPWVAPSCETPPPS